MKKSLLALAVLGAFAGAANAQTNVTVYGVADVGFGRDRTVNANNDTQMLGNSNMNNGTSRLGFRGTEDLGGGLKASFQFEQGINLESGINGGNEFNRQANVSLGGNWGTVTLGRQFNVGYDAIAAYDLTGTANYNVAERQFGYSGGGSRTNSMIKYTSPSFGGFTAKVSYVSDNDLVGAEDPHVALGLIYKGGPISAGLSYTRLPADQANGGDSDWSIGGAYDFGAFKVAASYLDNDSGRPVAGVGTGAKGYTLGAGTTFGAVSLVFDAARLTTDGVKNTDYLLEAKYSLSKRTSLYGAFYREGENDTNSFGLGVRHNF